MTGNSIHLGSTVISSSGGKVSFGGATLSTPLEITDHLIPDQNETYDLGNATHKFRDLYLSSATLNLGTSSLSVGPDGLTFTETAPVVLYKDTIQNFNPNLNSQYSRTDSITELGIVQSSDGTASSQFGHSPAISSDRIVVGTGLMGNTAFLFDLDGNQIAKLAPNDLDPFDSFGSSVDVSSNRVVVGAPGQTSGQGAVYIFDINGSQLNKIQSSDFLDFDSFGRAVAVSDTRIVVGAPDRQINNRTLGAAYIFDSDGNELAKLQSDITDEDLSFGIRVAVSENYVLVGAVSEDGSKGAVYMYTANGTFITKLKAPDGKSGDAFGNGLAINESLVASSRIVIGAYNEDTGATNSGAVYIYDIQGNFIKKIKPFDVETNARFGYYAVDVTDTRIVVGCAFKDSSLGADVGAVYIYDTLGNPLEKIEASDAQAQDGYGNGVAITNTRLVVGAPREDTANTNAGSIYLYDIDLSATPVYQPQIFGINGLDGIGKTSDWPEAVIANNHIIFSPETSFSAELTLYEATGASLHKFNLLPEGAGDWTDDPANGFTNIDTVNEGFIIDKFGKFWIKTPTDQMGFENYMQGVSFATFSILNIQNATPAKPLKPVDNPASIATTNVPSSATDTGTKGDIIVGTGYVYICKDTDSWVRVAIDTGW
jgi:hypothetical protein